MLIKAKQRQHKTDICIVCFAQHRDIKIELPSLE